MRFFLECLYAFIGSFCFGIIFNIKGKKLIFAGIGGAISQFSYLLLLLFSQNDIISYLFATIITALYSEFFARILKSPTIVFLVPSIIPLVPGGMMYYSMEKAISGNTNEFTNLLLETINVAGSLAIGILIVSSAVKFFKILKFKKYKRIGLKKNN